MLYKFKEQLSPYGCFVTALYNALVYSNTPNLPDIKHLITISQCEIYRKTRNKEKFLDMFDLEFQKDTYHNVLHSCGIVSIATTNYLGHFAFIYRDENNNSFIVNSFAEYAGLVHQIFDLEQFESDHYPSISVSHNYRLIGPKTKNIDSTIRKSNLQA